MPLSTTIAGATTLTLGSAAVLNDSVSTVGYLKFVLTKATSVDFGLRGGVFDLAIVNASNSVISVNSEPLESKNSGSVAEKLNRILQKGTYYLRVTGTGNFTLEYAANSTFIADICWRNGTTGQNTINTQANTAVIAELLTNPDPNWVLSAIADLDNDGYPDFLWRNNSTGEAAIWFMEGDLIASSVLIPNPGNGWRCVAAGDLNGDGVKDLIWRNIINGDNAVWFRTAGTRDGSYNSSALLSISVADQNWQIVGSADFNQNGFDDLVWRNNTTGDNAIWYMNGGTVTSTSSFNSVNDSNWRIFGVGDFNGNNAPDIYWHHRAGLGESAVWYMNNASFVSSSVVANITAYTFVPTAPYQRINQIDAGGSTLASAFDLGTINSTSVVSLNGHIGKFNNVNLFKFAVSSNTSISSWASTPGFSEKYLVKTEVLDSTGKLIAPNALFAALTPGTYYLRVTPVENQLNFRYRLDLVGINDPLPHVYVATNGSDSNSGTLSSPLATFNAALFAINGGGTIYVREGTYNQFINFYPGLSGTIDKPMVLKAYQTESVKVFNANDAAINMGNLSASTLIKFVRVEGIEVLSSPIVGIQCLNSQNILVKDCIVHDTQTAGVAFYSTDNTVKGKHNAVFNCTIYRACLDNPLPTNPTQDQMQAKFVASWASGIVMSRVVNGLVQENTVYEIGGEGTASTLSYGVTTFKNRFSDTFSAAIYLDNTIQCKVDSNHLYSTNNPAYYFPQTPAAGVQDLAMYPNSGIAIANELTYAERSGNNTSRNCRGNLIINNIVANSGVSLTINAPLVDTIISNNTLYQGVLGIVSYGSNTLSSTSTTGHSNSVFENNLMQQTNGAYGCGNRLNLLGENITGVIKRNNLMFGASLNDFAGTGDVTANPLMVNPSAYTNRDNFKIQTNSPAKNAGFTESVVTLDAYNTSRPQGSAYDIGAHEFV